MKLLASYQKLIEEFTSFIAVRNYRGDSKKYITPVAEFLEWLEKQGVCSIMEVTNSIAVDYVDYLSRRENKRLGGILSDSTINKHLFALRLFYENLFEQKHIEKGIVLSSKSDLTKKERIALSEEEIQELYKHCDTSFESALLTLAYGCGLRRTEIAQLDVWDIQFSKGILLVRSGKGGKRREVPMSDHVVEYLREYLLGERTELMISRKSSDKSFLLSSLGGRISGGQLNRRLKALTTRVTILEQKNVTLHVLRHSIATHLIERGATMDFVREFLGHSELDTAQIYTRRRKQRDILRI
jgi:site-specific recombinase XerD